MEWQFILMLCLLCFYCIIYIYFFFVSLKKGRKRKCMNRFYKIIKVLYEKNLPISDAVAQLQVDYNQLYLDPTCLCNYTLLEFLDIVIYYLDINAIQKLTTEQNIDKNKIKNIRDFVLDLRNQMIATVPFSNLPAEEASLMNSIQATLDPSKKKLGDDFLLQLSNEIQAKDKQLAQEKRKSNIAILLSIIGVVLTVFFGILSFV